MERHPLCQRLGLKHPIIKAPMAGGADSPQLIAAVGNAGGMGMIGAAYLRPEQLHNDITTLQGLSDKPFGINLFVPESIPPRPVPDAAIAALTPLCAAANLAPPQLPKQLEYPYDALLEIALSSGASALSFTFGLPPTDSMKKARQAGMQVFGTATNLAEAQQLSTLGVDAIIAQGQEAGGHRGGFLANAPMMTTLALTKQLTSQLDTPVISTGGLMHGKHIQTALQHGAAAVALGTAFLSCPEAAIPGAYKQALLNSQTDTTTLTAVFSGRLARGLPNTALNALTQTPDAVLPFPWQNALTKPLRSAAAQQNNADYLSLWAGQGVAQSRGQPAATLMAQLVAEMT